MIEYTDDYERDKRYVMVSRIVRILPSARGGGTVIVTDTGENLRALEHIVTIADRISRAGKPEGEA